jgi:dihydropyrimidine dehydrogenase (NAD+) subunit PreA
MTAWMEGKGYRSVKDIQGIALKNIVKTAEVPRKPKDIGMVIETTKCTRCGVCLRSCFYDAINLTKIGAVIDSKKCDVCGMCAEVCPTYAPHFVRR